MNIEPLIGKQFGQLTIVSPSTELRSNKYIKYVNCLCTCGKTKAISIYSLTGNRSKSCGCLSQTVPKYKGSAGLRMIYSQYKSVAKRYKRVFELTELEFEKLVQGNCYYCGTEPNNSQTWKKLKTPYLYNGIDRVDNNKGYTINNAVTCCKECNLAKSNLTQSQFFSLVQKIYHNRVEPTTFLNYQITN